jgi:hypothetical protein
MIDEEITQADRDAAAAYMEIVGDKRWSIEGILSGGCDNTSIVRAFARHRQPHTDALRIKLLEDAVIAVVEATRAYLPPDGIDAQECISRILEATDNPAINPVIFEIEDRAALKESK